MMNVSMKLREPSGQVVPEGPCFDQSRIMKTAIDGTRLSFKVPKHRPQKAYEPTVPEKVYCSDSIFFRESRNELLSVPYDWEYHELFEHAWAFYGPWFTGVQAEMRMFVRLLKPVHYANPDVSLFHPRAFEQMIGDYLTYVYAGTISDTQGGKCYSIGPLAWKPYEKLPMVAARLKVVSDPEVVTLDPRYDLFFPIADRLMVSMMFVPSQLTNIQSQVERDKRISPATMLELMEKIISSLEVELSSQAIGQQGAALAGLDDTSLVSEYPPLDWNSEAFRKKNFKP